MTDEQLRKQRERGRRHYANMTEEQRQRKRERGRKYALTMTEEQRARRKESLRQWEAKNPERKKSYYQRYYQANKEKISLRRKQNTRRSEVLRRYDLTAGSYDLLLASQGNKCAVCQEDFSRTPHVDHDHDTDVVRGLLCSQCNTALGLLKDSARIAFLAASYLQSHGKA